MIAILRCTCSHPFQDQEYGKGNRVHNPLPKKKDAPQRVRCSVCLDEKTLRSEVTNANRHATPD